MLNAITKDGLLNQEDGADTARGLRDSNFNRDFLSAEWVFQAKSKGIPDYHANMDGFMFMNWVKHMLISSFKKRYPGKKMILVLDNAKYHHVHPAGVISIAKATKTQLVKIAEQVGMAGFDCRRKLLDGTTVQKTFVASSFAFKGGQGGGAGPYLEELRSAVRKFVAENCPEKSELEKLFAEPEYEGWRIIYTPPYCPKFQPIERVWGYTKNGVATEFRSKRTPNMVWEDVKTMWYGGIGAKTMQLKDPLSAELVRKFIAGSERDMDAWIKAYGRSVKGTVADLKEGGEKYQNSDSESDGDDREEEGVGEDHDGE